MDYSESSTSYQWQWNEPNKTLVSEWYWEQFTQTKSPWTTANDATIWVFSRVDTNNAKVLDWINSLATAVRWGTYIWRCRDYAVNIIKSDWSLGTENKADIYSNWAGTAIYWWPTDNWSNIWTINDINNSNFGIVISPYAFLMDKIWNYLKVNNFGFTVPDWARIDWISSGITKSGVVSKTWPSTTFYFYIDYIYITVYYSIYHPPVYS